MSGNKIGGRKAAKTNKERYGDDWYAKIGKKGGENSDGGSFKDKELARKWGAVGGRKSRRGKAVKKDAENRDMESEILD